MALDLSTSIAFLKQRTDATLSVQSSIAGDWLWPLKTVALWQADSLALDQSQPGTLAQLAVDAATGAEQARGAIDARLAEMHRQTLATVGVMRVRALRDPDARAVVDELSARGNTRRSIEEEGAALLSAWKLEFGGAALVPAPGITYAGFETLFIGAAAAGGNPAVPSLRELKIDLSDASTTERKAVSRVNVLLERVERDVVDWYAEATAVFPEGTVNGDLIRSEIPTTYTPGGTPPIPLPTAPQNGSVGSGNAGSGEVNFDWQPAPAGQAVVEYHVYRDGVLVATVQGPPATLGGFTSGEAVTLTVRGVNATGEGPGSEPVTGTAG